MAFPHNTNHHFRGGSPCSCDIFFPPCPTPTWIFSPFRMRWNMYFFRNFLKIPYHNLTVEEYDVNGKTKKKKYESRKKKCRHHDGDFLLSRIFFFLNRGRGCSFEYWFWLCELSHQIGVAVIKKYNPCSKIFFLVNFIQCTLKVHFFFHILPRKKNSVGWG